jgi:hypothetical protein
MKQGIVSLFRSSQKWQPASDSNGVALPMCGKHKPAYVRVRQSMSQRTTTYQCSECSATYEIVEVPS